MLFVGNDWAEDHHDVEIVNEQGRRLVRRRLPEGLDGITRLHALIAQFFPEEWADLEPAEAASRVKVGIETERGPWVQALIAAGYEVFAINPMSVARYRERHSTSGAKSDSGDAHVLAEIVRLDRAHHQPVAGDSELGEAIKLVARSHQSLIWDRTRHILRLRSVLRDSSRQHSRPSLIWPLPTPSSCSRSHPIRTGPRGCPSPRSSRCCGEPTATVSRTRPPGSGRCCGRPHGANPPRSRRRSR
jgi:transposase